MRMLPSKRILLKSVNKKRQFKISYGTAEAPFGKIFLGFIDEKLINSICYLNFAENNSQVKENVVSNYEKLGSWTEAILLENSPLAQKIADKIFSDDEVTLNISIAGTSFHKAVWKELLKIPCGQTCTYGDIAERIGKPNAVRAVGTAVGSNKIAIIIPCHRVVSKNGDIKYGGGRERKINLLKYEYEKSHSHENNAMNMSLNE